MQRYKLKGTVLFTVLIFLLSVSSLASDEVYLGGFPFGVRMRTDGVYVSQIGEVDSTVGKVSPARDAGIKEGDVILSINNEETHDAQDVADIISGSCGKRLSVEIKRGDKLLTVNLIPVRTSDKQSYKTGLYIKDRASGIGTVTFVNTDGCFFGGLGHGITDRNTLELLPLGEGSVHNVVINDVTKGKKDLPGELKGSLAPAVAGTLLKNTEMGVFGRFDSKLSSLEKVELGEAKNGECIIRTCLEGDTPCEIKAEISEIVDRRSKTKNFIVTLTDKDILKKTGGIVQGMSGSPIVQNGKLVGAVTHVLMKDQTSGYGIFIENMIDAANRAS